MLGIALGRSKDTNGMIFYNPILDSMSVSADFLLDKNLHIGEVFYYLNESTRNVDLDHIFDKYNAPAPGTPSMLLAFFCPEWLNRTKR